MDDRVYLQNTTGGGNKCIPGVIVEKTGSVFYKVHGRDTDITDRRHGDQLRFGVIDDRLDQKTDCSTTDTPTQPCALKENMSTCPDPVPADSAEVPAASQSPRLSSRLRKPPEHYDP